MDLHKSPFAMEFKLLRQNVDKMEITFGGINTIKCSTGRLKFHSRISVFILLKKCKVCLQYKSHSINFLCLCNIHNIINKATNFKVSTYMIRKSHINFHQQMKSHIPSMCKHVTLELSSSKKKKILNFFSN